MRCPKCGYNKFDNLNNCSKCRADLSEERNRLNLPAGPLKPISLTEILKRVQSVKVEGSQPAEIAKVTQPDQPPAPKFFSVDLGEEATVSSPTKKWKAHPADQKANPGEGLSVDLTLE